MGYEPHQSLSALFSDMRRHKQFRRLQKLSHEVDSHIRTYVPVIPLWQLDTYIGISNRLDIGDQTKLDPIQPFRDAKSWRLKLKTSRR